MNEIRLRLAPSPTGFLHLGNLRTALFGYLLAKSMGGKYILRIEDTDQKREVAGAVEGLVKILSWVGITFDEGPHLGGPYEPYIQSQRLAIYKKYVDQLLSKDAAYRCWCTAEHLEKMRSEQAAVQQAPHYDRTCRNLTPAEIAAKLKTGEPFIVRQAMPLVGTVTVFDELRGRIVFKAEDLDDQVLLKSNGVPTYQLASVIDDHLMAISHVTRGDEWLPSLPKNILLYQALGWTPPQFIHLPLILNKGGGKLSKRQGDVYVEDFKAKGYLPEALINFCALLGWHPKSDPADAKAMAGKKEIFNLPELKKEFSIEGLGASPAVFDQEKLDYFNGYYIRQKSVEELAKLCQPYLIEIQNSNVKTQNQNSKLKTVFGTETDFEYLKKVVGLEQERLASLSEIKDKVKYFFVEPEYEAGLLIWKDLSREQIKNNLNELKTKIDELTDFSKLEEGIMSWLKESGKKNGDYLWPMRVALTGLKASPGPFEVALVLGKEKTLARITTAINKL